MQNEEEEVTNGSGEDSGTQNEVVARENDDSANKSDTSATLLKDGFPTREIPLKNINDEGIEVKPFEEAAQLDELKEDVVFETIDAIGRGGGPRFVINTDVKREARVYLPTKGKTMFFPIGRNSDADTEGGIIGSLAVEGNTKFRFISAKHKTQVTLLLVNGKQLVGYVLHGNAKGSRRALYFPKKIAEEAITLPPRGKQLKLEVAKMIVG